MSKRHTRAEFLTLLTSGLIGLVAMPREALAAPEKETDKAKIRRLTAERDSARRAYRHQRWGHLAHHKRWTKAQVKWALSEACRHYGITGSDRTWLIAAGAHVAWGESRYNTKSHKAGSQYYGLYQFGRSWKGSKADKLSGRWSTFRFVRVFRDGGAAKIREHWAQTIGGM